MPLLGAKTRSQLMSRLQSKWGADDDEPASKVAKRPSAAPSVLKRPANAEQVLKRPAAKRPASATEEDDAVEENKPQQRDRNKDGWLKRNIQELPDGIRTSIEKAAPGKRTQITNAIVEKTGDGSWHFNLEHPTVQELLRKEEGSYYKKGQRGVPFEIAKRKFGSADDLAKAVQEGRCQKIQQGGDEFYSWKEIKVGEFATSSWQMKGKRGGALRMDQYDSIADVIKQMGWYFSPTPQIGAALQQGQTPQLVESRLLKVVASCKKAKKEGEAVWNALLECPKTDTVQAARANLRRGLTDVQTTLTLFENMIALKSDDQGEPLKQDKIEADFMHAAASLQNLLELVEVANSYVRMNLE